MSIRIGSGLDFHQLVAGRELWVGGVKIPHSKGGLGHSDADVLLHAICDALLGAACLGDIGLHFPDTSSTYKDIDSRILLKSTNQLVHKAGYKIINIDSTVCLQEPRISSYIIQMRQEIAGILSVPNDVVSIKATTTENMGFVGRGEGMSAYATVLLESAQ